MRRRIRNERGQASIFMALFISSMILLFAFTTNIGMLVHAKINLQNAADAAAYAGAAVQARQLTSVAYLNYEMRRAVKEFSYYLMYRGNRSQACMPTTGAGARNPACPARNPSGRYSFAFFRPGATSEPDGGAQDLYVPTVCIIFDESNNYCQLAGVPGIPRFPGGGSFGVADPIVSAVKNATDIIISKKIADCNSRTLINQMFVVNWLFNLNPNPQLLSGGTPDKDDPFDVVGIDRLGVLPRIAILRGRIDNFEEMLNMNLGNEGFSQKTISTETIAQLQSAASGNKSLDYFERPIQAYLSARNNLPDVDQDNGIFSEVELSELVPDQSNVNPSDGLKNPPILAKFDDIKHNIAVSNSAFQSGANGECSQFREVRMIEGFPFGVAKDPSVMTYYAVRLQAKARLLFSPFGSDGMVTLSAYSAAKPFGSRIGKSTTENPEKYLVSAGKLNKDSPLFGANAVFFPNILVTDEGDEDARNNGFSRNAFIGYLNQIVTQTQRRDLGLRVSGAYSPWEVGFFNPPANFQSPEDIGHFSENPRFDNGVFMLTAPLMPINGSSDVSFIRDRVMSYMTGASVSAQASFNNVKSFVLSIMSDAAFGTLFGYMQSNGLVDFHPVPDPLLQSTIQQNPMLGGLLSSRFTVAARSNPQKRQLSSWNNQKTATDADQGINPNSELGQGWGRSGYSVRFISFNSLRKGGQGTNDPDKGGIEFSDPFAHMDAGGDAAARIQDDLTKVKH